MQKKYLNYKFKTLNEKIKAGVATYTPRSLSSISNDNTKLPVNFGKDLTIETVRGWYCKEGHRQVILEFHNLARFAGLEFFYKVVTKFVRQLLILDPKLAGEITQEVILHGNKLFPETVAGHTLAVLLKHKELTHLDEEALRRFFNREDNSEEVRTQVAQAFDNVSSVNSGFLADILGHLFIPFHNADLLFIDDIIIKVFYRVASLDPKFFDAVLGPVLAEVLWWCFDEDDSN